MYYSSVGALALIIHLIVNRNGLKNPRDRVGISDSELKVALRYRYFLISVVFYLVTDVAWGLLYENRDIPAQYPLIYSCTVFYFIFMLLTMLTWMRYVVAYLDKRRRRSKALLYAIWIIFTMGILYLMANRFHPLIFYFNENHEYIPVEGRYMAYLVQIALYVVTTTYMLYIAKKSKGYERMRYNAVGVTCLVMGLFQVFQILEPIYPFYAMGLIIGACVIHSFVVEGERKDKAFYDSIASGLAEDYEAMYYINIETGEYREFSRSQKYESMNVPVKGKDFYTETRENVARYVHPDDREFAVSLYYKETMLENLEGKKSYNYKYRVMVNGEPRYFLFTVVRTDDERHMVLYEKDIDDEITLESMWMKSQKKHITFNRIAESLASNYDIIYYVDAEDNSYISYKINEIYGQLEIAESGDDFYEETAKNIPRVVYDHDRERVSHFLDRDNMVSAMEIRRRHSIDYRLVVDGVKRYFRITVRKSSDNSHFILGVENIDAEVKKEKEQLKALNSEKELARRDELTGIKNKTAYKEMEDTVQSEMDDNRDNPAFGIVICDANDLKKINDTEGHVSGDEYIKASAKMLCDIFTHSPVFRVGGDEFAVFLRGRDYDDRQELMHRLQSMAIEHKRAGRGPVLASGLAEYEPGIDKLVSEVYQRADRRMYDNKVLLKNGNVR